MDLHVVFTLPLLLMTVNDDKVINSVSIPSFIHGMWTFVWRTFLAWLVLLEGGTKHRG